MRDFIKYGINTTDPETFEWYCAYFKSVYVYIVCIEILITWFCVKKLFM